MQEEAFTP